MAEDPENLVLTFLRNLDAKMDRILDTLRDLRHRMAPLERQTADLRVGTDNLTHRADRIERRLDLIDAPAG